MGDTGPGLWVQKLQDFHLKVMTLLARFILLCVALIWGWTFVLVKESLEEIGTFAFLFYRFALALLLLLLLFRPRLRHVASLWVKGALIGLALFSGYWFQTLGLNYTTATNSAFITGLSVVLVPMLGSLLFRRRARRATWFGSLISIAGLALLVFGSGKTGRFSLNAGDLLTMFCAVSFAMHILLIDRYTRPTNYVPILITQIGVVMVLSGLGMVAFEGLEYPRTWSVYKGLFITGFFATALAFWAQNRFQPLISAGHTAIIFAGEPVFAAMFGYLFLGEHLTARQWLGAALILAAMLIAQLPSARRASRRKDHAT